MINLSDEEKKEAKLKAFELFLTCLSSGPCNNCVFYDPSIDIDPCSIGCPNSWPLFDNETSIGAANRKLVLDFLHKKELSKAAQELTPIVDICPCNKCSDDVRMSCKIVCNEYYYWVRRLKGESK